MKTLAQILAVIVIAVTLGLVLRAQVAVDRIDAGLLKEPLVVAQGDSHQVRFTAFAVVNRVRLQVAIATGEMAYDSGWQSGNLIEWRVEDQQGLRLGDGMYRCQVTIEEVTGRILRRQAEMQFKEGHVFLASAGQSRMDTGNDDDAPLYMLSPETAWGWLPHDGREARIESGKGSLVLHAGRYEGAAGKALPHVRLTADGNLGIGVAEPTARLDVGGWIRTTEGIQFPDGTVQRTSSTPAVFASTPGEEFAGADAIARTWPGRTGAAKVGSRISTSRLSDDSKASLGKPGLAHGGEGTEGPSNTLFGQNAGIVISTGNWNSLFGVSAGSAVNTGAGNSFFGYWAGRDTNSGNDNSFFGSGAGAANTTGNNNSFFGHNAGLANTTAIRNSFFGRGAGAANTIGNGNAFFGDSAGETNSTGGWNTFFGADAGKANTAGEYNAFFGAGYSNTTGGYNTFFGAASGWSNTVERYNTFIGYFSDGAAGITNATALGHRARVTQSNSLVLGSINGINSATADTKVGIGTTAPDSKLTVVNTPATLQAPPAGTVMHFQQSDGSGAVMAFDTFGTGAKGVFWGRTARGTSAAPSATQADDTMFSLRGSGYGATAKAAAPRVRINFNAAENWTDTAQGSYISFDTTANGTTTTTERVRITESGMNVTGTLSVNGTAMNVPDYVFEPGYRLMPLEELAQFVAREKHLPDVPDSDEINKNGLDIGDFQMRTLKKVEELTLYTLNQHNQINALQSMNAALQIENASLKGSNNFLKESHNAIQKSHSLLQESHKELQERVAALEKILRKQQ